MWCRDRGAPPWGVSSSGAGQPAPADMQPHQTDFPEGVVTMERDPALASEVRLRDLDVSLAQEGES